METKKQYYFAKVVAVLAVVSGLTTTGNAGPISHSDTAYKMGLPMSGHVWGYIFGDYYYKSHSDSLSRGGKNQYTGIPEKANAFALRRVYLGYDFNISSRFDAELLITAEDWTTKEKLPFFVKYANVRWKNIWEGADLRVGLSKTPGFSGSSEKVWGYRSIERTIADRRGTQSYDLGISLKGRLDRQGNWGYFLMVGNGTGAFAENNRFKKFYGSVFASFFDKRLTVNLYADYERIHWQPSFHHARNMIKLFVGYETAKLTVGTEAFLSRRKDDVVRNTVGSADTLDANATGISLFVRGSIMKDRLGFFARMDLLNPYTGYAQTSTFPYEGLTSAYEPNTQERFVTVGLDYSPVKNVHFMPNVWYNAYLDQSSVARGSKAYDFDLVYRMTFYFVFGK